MQQFEVIDAIPRHLPQYSELQQIRGEVFTLLARADQLAVEIRAATKPQTASIPG